MLLYADIGNHCLFIQLSAYPTLQLCLQEYLCCPAEVQRRTATFAAKGEIRNEVPNSSSVSFVGSSAATWGSTQETQFGTAGQQATAAAALMLSQMCDEDHKGLQQPVGVASLAAGDNKVEMQAVEAAKHDAQLQQPAVSAAAGAAGAATLAAGLPSGTAIHQQAEAGAADGAINHTKPAAEPDAAEHDAVQQLDVPVPHGHHLDDCVSAMAQPTQDCIMDLPATETQHLESIGLDSSDVQHRGTANAVQREATEVPCEHHSLGQQAQVQADRPTERAQLQEMTVSHHQQREKVVQALSKQASAEQQSAKGQLDLSGQTSAANSSKQAAAAPVAPAERLLCSPSAAIGDTVAKGKATQQAAADGAKGLSPAEAAVASPTQHLHLLLTCQDMSPEVKQKPQGPTRNAGTDAGSPSSCEDSPKQLQLGLDTQLPSPGAAGAKSPHGVLGWLGGGWSVPQGLPHGVADMHGPSSQSDSQQLPDFTCHVAEKQGALPDGTEVTPSGVRPPRGLSSTPLALAAGSSETSLQGTLTPHGLVKPAGAAQQAAHIVLDSEEGPLVLPRPHGPPHKGFADAHILPCSSPGDQDPAEDHAGKPRSV